MDLKAKLVKELELVRNETIDLIQMRRNILKKGEALATRQLSLAFSPIAGNVTEDYIDFNRRIVDIKNEAHFMKLSIAENRKIENKLAESIQIIDNLFDSQKECNKN